MKKSIFLWLLFSAVIVSAQEIPVAETEDSEIETADGASADGPVTAGETDGPVPLSEAAEPAAEAAEPAAEADGETPAEPAVVSPSSGASETAADDDALVWDAGTGDGEQSLPDAAAATVDVPILRRAEYAARKEWEAVSEVVRPTEVRGKLLLAVLTDIRVKQIRIAEDSGLGKTEKKIRLNFLRYEKNSRLRAVLDKQQYKLYREWEKSKSESERRTGSPK